MTRYGMVIDINKCVGCYNCFLACRDEYCGNEYPPTTAAQPMAGQNWIRVVERERGKYPKVKVNYTPILCMHCDAAHCVAASKDKAVYRRPDGVVIIDPVKSKGQKQILQTCPYRVIEWNEEKQLPQKCTFCAHLIDAGWKEPRCVEACPSGALIWGDLDNPESAAAKALGSKKTEILHPEFSMKEKVTYIDLPKKFVAGTVIFGDIDECAGNISVTLAGNGETKKTKTNNFGDFEFEGLPDNTSYTVKIEAPGYKARSVKAKTVTDIFLGEIVLKK